MDNSERGAGTLSNISATVDRALERLSHEPQSQTPDGLSQAQIRGRLRRAGLDTRLLEATVADIPNTPKAELGNWMQRAETHLQDGRGLYLWGDVGAGKSMAATCVVRQLAEHTDSIYWRQTSQLLIGMENPYARDDLLRKAMTVRLLILDDFGTQLDSAKYQEWLDLIVDARYRRKKTTIATSNVQPAMLPPQLERVADRWKQVMTVVHFKGRSKRKAEES